MPLASHGVLWPDWCEQIRSFALLEAFVSCASGRASILSKTPNASLFIPIAVVIGYLWLGLGHCPPSPSSPQHLFPSFCDNGKHCFLPSGSPSVHVSLSLSLSLSLFLPWCCFLPSFSWFMVACCNTENLHEQLVRTNLFLLSPHAPF